MRGGTPLARCLRMSDGRLLRATNAAADKAFKCHAACSDALSRKTAMKRARSTPCSRQASPTS